MTSEQAADIVALLRAATRGQVDDSTIGYFEAALVALDYQPALGAATIGTVTWRMFPSWAEFKEAYRAQARLAEIDQDIEYRKTKTQDEFKRGVAAPEWVWVWSWARGWSERGRAPVEKRLFPQQAQYVDMREVMTMDQYETLLAEWVTAGSPKGPSPLPIMR